MPVQNIPLTREEAATIAQRALVEMIVGKPGIWSHLNERVLPVHIRCRRPNKTRGLTSNRFPSPLEVDGLVQGKTNVY